MTTAMMMDAVGMSVSPRVRLEVALERLIRRL
jgi:hypothetical protein